MEIVRMAVATGFMVLVDAILEKINPRGRIANTILDGIILSINIIGIPLLIILPAVHHFSIH